MLFNPRKNTQTHVLNGCRKTVTSLALSGDGRLLATGECGHMPNVRVWDISDSSNAVQIAEFSGHKYGINCVVSVSACLPACDSTKSIVPEAKCTVKSPKTKDPSLRVPSWPSYSAKLFLAILKETTDRKNHGILTRHAAIMIRFIFNFDRP